MTKKTIFIIILAIILLGLGLVLAGKDSRQNTELENINQTENENELSKRETLIGEGSLKDLLLRRENLECTIAYEDSEASGQIVNGTYFTSQSRLRGDFIMNDSGMEVVSSMIMVDNTLYTWSEIEGEKYGMKIDLSTTESVGVETKPDTREPVPLDDKVKYDCRAWNDVDGSIFEPPTDIIFSDYGSLIGTGMEFGTIYEEGSGAASSCAVCRQIPAGANRDECLVTFSCE